MYRARETKSRLVTCKTKKKKKNRNSVTPNSPSTWNRNESETKFEQRIFRERTMLAFSDWKIQALPAGSHGGRDFSTMEKESKKGKSFDREVKPPACFTIEPPSSIDRILLLARRRSFFLRLDLPRACFVYEVAWNGDRCPFYGD